MKPHDAQRREHVKMITRWRMGSRLSGWVRWPDRRDKSFKLRQRYLREVDDASLLPAPRHKPHRRRDKRRPNKPR